MVFPSCLSGANKGSDVKVKGHQASGTGCVRQQIWAFQGASPVLPLWDDTPVTESGPCRILTLSP